MNGMSLPLEAGFCGFPKRSSFSRSSSCLPESGWVSVAEPYLSSFDLFLSFFFSLCLPLLVQLPGVCALRQAECAGEVLFPPFSPGPGAPLEASASRNLSSLL